MWIILVNIIQKKINLKHILRVSIGISFGSLIFSRKKKLN